MRTRNQLGEAWLRERRRRAEAKPGTWKRNAVVGAGRVGETTAQILAEQETCREIVLIDVREDVPQGVALDIFQTAPFFEFDTRVSGSNDPAAMAGAEVVVLQIDRLQAARAGLQVVTVGRKGTAAMRRAHVPLAASFDGFGAHGTPEPESIGTMASAGCIRMLDADIAEYFQFVPRGSKVVVRSSR